MTVVVTVAVVETVVVAAAEATVECRGEECRDTDTTLTISPVCSSSMESLEGSDEGRGAGGQSRVCSRWGGGGGRGNIRSSKLVWEDME